MSVKRSETHKINDWDTWKELCSFWQVDPYETIDYGFDIGGGDTVDYEYIGEYPIIKENKNGKNSTKKL